MRVSQTLLALDYEYMTENTRVNFNTALNRRKHRSYFKQALAISLDGYCLGTDLYLKLISQALNSWLVRVSSSTEH